MEAIKENKRSYAILMERMLIKQDQYIFRPKYLIEGTLEESNMTFENEMDKDFKYKEDSKVLSFIDTMENEYLLSTNSVLLNGDCDESVYYVISEEELLKKYGDSLEDAKRQYFAHYSEDVVSLGFYLMDEDRVDIFQFNFNDLHNKLRGISVNTNTLTEEEKNEITQFQMDVAFLEKIIFDLENHKEKDVLNVLKALRNIDMEAIGAYIKTGKIKSKDEIPSFDDKNFINSLFESTYSEILNINDYDEAIKTLGGILNMYTNLCLDLDNIEDEKDEEFASNFLYRYIDALDNLLSCVNLASIKDGIVTLREEEVENVKKLNDIYYGINKKRSIDEKKDLKKVKKDEIQEEVISTNDISVSDMKAFLDRKVIGQEKAKRSVIQTIVMNNMTNNPKARKSCLLVGPTGSGKTLLFESASEYLKKPLVLVDTTQITIPGYVGKNLEEFFSDLIRNANGDVEAAQRGIVVFDEIDKKGSEKNSDVSGKGVLNTLLPCLQGTDYDVKYNGRTVKFSTKNLTFFATGAFTDVQEFKLKKSGYNGNKIGFGFNTEEAKEKIDIEYPKLEIEDFVQYGNMPREFMGRISSVVQLTGHTVDSLVRILRDSDNSVLKFERDTLSKTGIELEWTDEFLIYMANEALKLKTGARSLGSILEELMDEPRFFALDENNNCSKILLTTDEDNKFKGILFDKEGKEISYKDEKQKVLQKN